jgi:hypothetical protein
MELKPAFPGHAPRRGIAAAAILAEVTLIFVLLTSCQSVPVGPSLTVYDQFFQNGYMTVYRAFSDGPGWLVLYNQEKGEPGKILGQAHIQGGVSYDVRIFASETQGTSIMYVALHADLGKAGIFEFPGPDEPVVIDEKQVITRFRLRAEMQNVRRLPD